MVFAPIPDAQRATVPRIHTLTFREFSNLFLFWPYTRGELASIMNINNEKYNKKHNTTQLETNEHQLKFNET